MAKVEKSIDVNVPVRTAYNQWTQFEQFPRFMEGVKEVRQLEDQNLHWRATVGGKEVEWTATITFQEPDRRIAWQSIGGATNAGSVSFTSLGPDTTRITLQLEYEPQGVVENTGSALGVVSLRVDGDLKRFKEFIERQGHETGAWRGAIHGSTVTKPSSQPSSHQMGAGG